MRSSKKISKIRLIGFQKVNDDSVNAIGYLCPNATSITFSECHFREVESLQVLKEKSVSLILEGCTVKEGVRMSKDASKWLIVREEGGVRHLQVAL